MGTKNFNSNKFLWGAGAIGLDCCTKKNWSSIQYWTSLYFSATSVIKCYISYVLISSCKNFDGTDFPYLILENVCHKAKLIKLGWVVGAALGARAKV